MIATKMKTLVQINHCILMGSNVISYIILFNAIYLQNINDDDSPQIQFVYYLWIAMPFCEDSGVFS